MGDLRVQSSSALDWWRAEAHLVRVPVGWDFSVGGWGVPSLGSVVAVAVAGYLGWTGFRIAARSS